MALFSVNLEVDNVVMGNDTAESSIDFERLILSKISEYERMEHKTNKAVKLEIKTLFNESLYYFYIKPDVLREIEKAGLTLKFSCAFLEED